MYILIYATNGQLNDSFNVSHTINSSEATPCVAIGNMVADILEHDEIAISYCDPNDPPGTYNTDIFNNSGLIRTLDYGNTETVGLFDLTDNGLVDLFIGDGFGHIKAYDAQNNVLIWDQPADLRQIKSSPVIGDIHPSYDSVEINFGTDFQKAHLRKQIDGYPISPWPDTITGIVRTSDALGHINGDNNLDIITATQGFLSSPILGDINGDRRNEVIISTADHYLHVLKNNSSSVSRYSLEWPQFHHDYQHTGLFGW
jgi:hypothetical protein